MNYSSETCKGEEYTNLLFYATREKSENFSMFDLDTIQKNVSYKLSEEY